MGTVSGPSSEIKKVDEQPKTYQEIAEYIANLELAQSWDDIKVIPEAKELGWVAGMLDGMPKYLQMTSIQKWLREKHDVLISIMVSECVTEMVKWTYEVLSDDIPHEHCFDDELDWEDYDEALEIALRYGLWIVRNFGVK